MSNISPLLPLVATIVPEDQITQARISAILNSAYIDHCLEDDGDIYVTDVVAFPLWINLDQQSKLLMMVTHFKPDREPSFNWLEKVNELNANIVLPQFCYREGGLWGCYWLSYERGLNVRQFIKLMRRFAEAFRLGAERVG